MRIKRKYLPFCIIPLFFLILGGVFFFRSPVLIVTDTSFYQLYGSLRFRIRGLKASLELFRRVIPVSVAENAGPDLMVIAVEGVSGSPRAVLFPYRYLAGAQIYREKHPDVPVLVIGGKNPNPQAGTAGGGLSFVSTDTIQDLYRAGLCAAVLAAERGVLFYSDGVLLDGEREAFREGLRAQGFLDDPVYLDVSAEYYLYSGIGCVVIAGPAAQFLDEKLKIPIILFSWVDPELTPQEVKLVFDDSPMTLAVEVLGSFGAGEILVSSEPVLLGNRIEEKKDFRRLRGLIKEKFRNN